PHHEAAQIGVRVEKVRPPRHGRAIGRLVAVPHQGAQEWLFRHTHADPLHPLVVPRALHGEQPQQALPERRLHESHATTVPPASPAANQRRAGPRPTRRSVPAMPTARAPATPATASPATPPKPRPKVPAPACAALTAATVAGPYSG